MSASTPRAPYRSSLLGADDGFTLVEVLVAGVLLMIGSFATLALLDNGAKATSVSRQRDVANAVAQEMIERSTGGRNTLSISAAGVLTGRNDMTDIDPGATPSVVGPAERLRTAMDRTAGSASSAVAPVTVTTGNSPVFAPQTWTTTRSGTSYTVSYRACTTSDPYTSAPGQTLTIQGPYDCSRATSGTAPIGTPVTPAIGTPKCNLLNLSAASSGTGTGSNPTDPISVGIQLLGLVGIDACLGPNLQPLTAGLCQVLGTGGIASDLLSGASGLLGQLNVGGVNAQLCDPAQIEPSLSSALRLTASATRIAVTVRWTDRGGKANTIERSTIVRRST